MERFSIDESGYTGFDLLNDDQRFQGAAAIGVSDEDAARLIKAHFPRLQAEELKYSAVSRRAGNAPRLLGLLGDLLSEFKSVTYVCDKRYLLVLFFCEYAVEPFYYARGEDFYKDGQNYALASLLYSVGPTLFGKEKFDAILGTFQYAVKEKTPEALDALVERVREANWRELPEALEPLAQFRAPECLEAIATPGVSTDAAFVVLQSLISRLETIAGGRYRVEHDQSKNLLIYHDMLERMISHDLAVEFRHSQIATLSFPLNLTGVVQVNSKNSSAVQLADVMVGMAIDAGNTLAGLRSSEVDPDATLALYRPDQFIHLLPSLEFQKQKHFRQGTQAAEMIDYFAKNFVRPKGDNP